MRTIADIIGPISLDTEKRELQIGDTVSVWMGRERGSIEAEVINRSPATREGSIARVELENSSLKLRGWFMADDKGISIVNN